MKHTETNTYESLVNRMYGYGIQSYDEVYLINERLKNNSLDQDGLEGKMQGIITDLTIATEASAIAANHWNLTIESNAVDSVSEISGFFRYLSMNLKDILNTEKDFVVWKQTCAELEDILKIVKDNISEEQLISADYTEVKTMWKETMELVRKQHSKSRLLSSYFTFY